MSSFRRRLMMAQTDTSIPGVRESEVGDICVYNVNSGKLAIIKSAEWSASAYPIATYVPVGIVAVPASHGHYEGGKCAIVSLNHMNCDTPTIGGSSQFLCWGTYETDIDTLPNLDQVPYVGSNGTVGGTVIGTSGGAYLPSDFSQFTAVANPYDNKTKYHYNDEKYYAPSPYKNDETFNTEYYRITPPSSTANCLADFDGYNNTKNILTIRGDKDYSNWKPGQYVMADYPPASCCDMYFTPGTKQGDWYLPSEGELGYMVVRRQTIEDSLNKLIKGGVSSANIFAHYFYWSSSHYSGDKTASVGVFDGGVFGYNVGSACYVRAFALV